MYSATSSIPTRLGLKAGEWIVIRSKEEILATLDEHACLDALPFQPEMFAFCGRRMRVAKVAHKTCDNIKKTGGRRMLNAVHLEGARCDGAAHDGCQADCVFFWKEAWLRREQDGPAAITGRGRCSESDVAQAAFVPGTEGADGPVWVCQTTKLYDATTHLHWWDVRQYVRDVTSGNHSAWYMTKLLIFAGYRRLVALGVGYRVLVGFYNWFQRLRGGKPYPLEIGTIPEGKPTPVESLNLQPGELVEVRSQEEILATITDKTGRNRGMRYDIELAKYCGERHRVQMRVEKFIDEISGRMLRMKSPCIQLEDVYCRGECTTWRIGCPRASNIYWREIWLRRADGPRT